MHRPTAAPFLLAPRSHRRRHLAAVVAAGKAEPSERIRLCSSAGRAPQPGQQLREPRVPDDTSATSTSRHGPFAKQILHPERRPGA